MTISYTALLGLAQPVTGTETGQWGTVVNDEITALLEDAVANAASISVTAGNVTLSTTNGSSNQARMSTLIITGTPGTTRNVVAPSQAKIYVVINQSDGAVVIKGAATSGVTIGAGQTAQVAWNGSDFVEIGNYVHGNFVVNGNLSVNGDSTLGNAGADTTTINGQVIAANSNISKTTTLSASAPALAWIKGATYTDTGTAGGTTQALAPFTVFSTPTLSTSNIVTYTDAATVYIAGAPAAAGSATITNPYSLYVAAGNAYFGASVSATTLDLTNLEVTNIKAKDGTASMTLADSTGIITLSATAGTANGVAYLNGSRALTTGSALTFDGTNLGVNSASPIDGGRFSVAFAGNTQNGIGLKDTADASGASFWGAYNSTGGFIGSLRRSSTDNALAINGNSYLAFQQNSTELMRLTSTGLKASIAGTNADPVFSYTSDTNTGIFFPAADKLGFTAGGGSDQMVLTSTGLGIGTSSPAAKLDVATTTPFTFDTTSTAGVKIGTQGTVGGSFMVQTQSASAPYGSGLAIDGTYSGATLQSTVNIKSFGVYSGGGYGSSLAFWTSSGTTLSQKMLLDSSGNLGLGVTPSAWRSTNKALQVAQSASLFGYTASNIAALGNNVFINSAGDELYINDGTAAYYRQNGNAHEWYRAASGTAGNLISFTQAMTLDASGNLIVGATSATSGFRLDVVGGDFRVSDVASDDGVEIGWSAGGNQGFVQAYDRNASAFRNLILNAAATIDSSGNLGLGVTPSAWSGTALQVLDLSALSATPAGNTSSALTHAAFWDGTDWRYTTTNVGATRYQMTGANAGSTHSWSVAAGGTAGNAISFTQAMTLDASGNFYVGTTSQVGGSNITFNQPNNADLKIAASVSTATRAVYQVFVNSAVTTIGTENSTGGSLASGTAAYATVLANNSAYPICFATNNTERARITSGGDLLVGQTSQSATTNGFSVNFGQGATIPAVSVAGASSANTESNYTMYSTSAAAYRFYVGYGGTISATNTTISAISDQRFKENIRDLDIGLDSILALKPRKFDWKAGKGKDKKDDRGFIAQEFEQVFPDLIDQWLDPAPEGEEPYKAVRADLIPVLVKAIQEQQAMINELKAEVAALKGA